MNLPGSGWFSRHRGWVPKVVIGILILVVAAQAFLLYQQRSVAKAVNVQSAKLLTTFLQGDTVATSGANGVPIRLQNVRFKWSPDVYIDTGDMAVRAVPVKGSTVVFDDLESFVLRLQESTVAIRPDVLAGMFNESVFNYPESKIRKLKVMLTQRDNQPDVRLEGSVNVVTWIPFRLDTHLSVDRKTNTLVIDVDHAKVFGFLSVTKLIKWKPFRLQQLIALPPNNSLIVDDNRMMVKPFGLFPPPRVSGQMSDVTVDGSMIRLKFAGDPIPAPKSDAKNYVYLKGGTAQFGHFRMLDTDILILDQTQGDSFGFSLAHYAEMVPRSTIDIHDTRSVRVTMPDY
jgi:signal peptidase I